MCIQLIRKPVVTFVFLNLVNRRRETFVGQRGFFYVIMHILHVVENHDVRAKLCYHQSFAPILYFQSRNSRFHDLLLKFAAISKAKLCIVRVKTHS